MTPTHKAALSPFLVATKHRGKPVGAEWWKELFEGGIALARRQYDAGVVEMCQGYDAGTYYLYAIPRVKQVEQDDAYKFSVWLGDEAYA